MDKVKVLHCADLHLGSGLFSILERGKERQQELLRTFRRITNLCLEEKVDVLLIAGDLFEGSNIDQQMISSVKEYIGNLKETIVAISPGNHDYVSLDSPYQDKDWPGNTIIFNGDFESKVFQDKGFAIHGFGFESTYVREGKIIPIGEEFKNLINLCVVHGDLVSGLSDSIYHPITEKSLQESRMDYVAIGHIHKRTAILKTGNTSYAYSGCPDGRGFDELGEKGVYLGWVSKGRADMSFIPMSSRVFIEESIDISGETTTSSVEKMIMQFLKEKYTEEYARHYYKIRLVGNLPEDHAVFFEALELDLKESLYYVKLREETRIDLNIEALSEESSLKGIFVKKMLEKIEEEKNSQKMNNSHEIEKLEKALDYGLRAFDGKVKLNVD